MITVTVAPGDTLSQIAAQYGTSYQAIAQASGISDPNVIYAGEQVVIPSGGSFTSWTSSSISGSSQASSQSGSGSSSSATGSSSASGFSVPGMPQSLADCIAFRESTNGTNPAANGNVFGIIPASGYNVAGYSLSQQEQVAGQLYAQYGGSPWSADGCPGT